MTMSGRHGRLLRHGSGLEDCGRLGRRISRGVLLCALLLFVLALGASGGTGNAAANRSVAVASTEPSLELAKTADEETVDAGDPIGFRIDLTNHGEIADQGRVIIEKRLDPNWATGTFPFNTNLPGTGSFSLGAAVGLMKIKTFKAVAPGSYTVTEDPPPAGFTLTDLSCDDPNSNSTWNVGTRQATISLQAGETVRCIFTNHIDHGRVIIEKRLDPNWATGTFPFNTNLPGTGSFSLGAAVGLMKIKTFKAVAPGSYTVTEDPPPAGFTLTDLSCDDPNSNSTWNVGTRQATISLQAGETVRCIFTNHIDHGRVIIEKRLDPNWATGTFPFNTNLPGTGSFSLGAAVGLMKIKTFKAVAPGSYTVTEDPPPAGFTLTDLSCDDPNSNSTWNVGTRQATISLQAGETVRCIFTNHDSTITPNGRGVVIVEKQAPATHNPSLETSGVFTDDIEPCNVQGIGSGNEQTCANVVPGTYMMTETGISGSGRLVSLRCDDTNSSWDLATRSATIRVEANETVRCVWVNEDRRGWVIVEKQAPATHNPSLETSGVFTDDIEPCNVQGIGSGNEQTCANVVPGTYMMTETGISGSGRLVSLRCDDTNSSWDLATRSATIRVEANETVRCVWVNEDRRGWVIVEKQAPATHNPSLETSGVFTDDIEPCNVQGIGSGNEQTCANVVPGTYMMTETGISGSGRLVSLRCDDTNSSWDLATRSATIRLEADETVRCTWVNETVPGPGAATNVILTDNLPVGPGLSWSLDPAVDGCSIQGQLLSCLFASLGDGEKVSVHVTSPTTTASCGRYDNTAVARADGRTAVRASASVTVDLPGHDHR